MRCICILHAALFAQRCKPQQYSDVIVHDMSEAVDDLYLLIMLFVHAHMSAAVGAVDRRGQ